PQWNAPCAKLFKLQPRDQFPDTARFLRPAAARLRPRKNPGRGEITRTVPQDLRRPDQAALPQPRNPAPRDLAKSQRKRIRRSEGKAPPRHGLAAVLRADLSQWPDRGTNRRLQRQDRPQSGWNHR